MHFCISVWSFICLFSEGARYTFAVKYASSKKLAESKDESLKTFEMNADGIKDGTSSIRVSKFIESLRADLDGISDESTAKMFQDELLAVQRRSENGEDITQNEMMKLMDKLEELSSDVGSDEL